jgi:hypothetical protein
MVSFFVNINMSYTSFRNKITQISLYHLKRVKLFCLTLIENNLFQKTTFISLAALYFTIDRCKYIYFAESKVFGFKFKQFQINPKYFSYSILSPQLFTKQNFKTSKSTKSTVQYLKKNTNLKSSRVPKVPKISKVL